MKVVLMVALMAFAPALNQNASAHEGHDVPGSIQAQHGGTVKAAKTLYLELVQEGNNLKLYPLTHDLKPIPLQDLQVEATAQLPRAKDRTSVKIAERAAENTADSHFIGTFDAKGAHRYTLSVTTKYLGKKDTLIFQVEPHN